MLHFARSGLCFAVASLVCCLPALVRADAAAPSGPSTNPVAIQAVPQKQDEKIVPLWALLAVDPAAADAPAEAPPQRTAQAGDNDEPPPAEPAPLDIDAENVKKKTPLSPEEEPSVFRTWWFWALTAVIVGGTVALGVAAADTVEPAARSCAPTVIACFGDGRGGSR